MTTTTTINTTKAATASFTTRLHGNNPEGQPISAYWAIDLYDWMGADAEPLASCIVHHTPDGERMGKTLGHWSDDAAETAPDWVPRPDFDAVVATLRYLRGDLS